MKIHDSTYWYVIHVILWLFTWFSITFAIQMEFKILVRDFQESQHPLTSFKWISHKVRCICSKCEFSLPCCSVPCCGWSLLQDRCSCGCLCCGIRRSGCCVRCFAYVASPFCDIVCVCVCVCASTVSLLNSFAVPFRFFDVIALAFHRCCS